MYTTLLRTCNSSVTCRALKQILKHLS